MTYDFKKGPEDFSWVTTEMFDEELKEILASDNDAVSLLSIPGIYEILAEHYNNEILVNLKRHREEAEDNDKDEIDTLTDGDECPNCASGTLEVNVAGELVCRGECGAVLRRP